MQTLKGVANTRNLVDAAVKFKALGAQKQNGVLARFNEGFAQREPGHDKPLKLGHNAKFGRRWWQMTIRVPGDEKIANRLVA